MSVKDKRTDFYEQRFGFEQSAGDEKNPHQSPKLMKVLEAFDSGDRILDLGCNNGEFLKAISDKLHAKEAYGLDISEEAVKKASRYPELKISRFNFDEENLAFEDGYFDACLCGDVIEHLFSPDHLITEVYRVLKPGGYAVFTTPNLASWYNRISLLFGWQPGWTEVSTRHIVGHPLRKKRTLEQELRPSGHLRIFTAGSLIELLQIYNFKIDTIKGYSFFTHGILGIMDSAFSYKSSLASFVLIKARK